MAEKGQGKQVGGGGDHDRVHQEITARFGFVPNFFEALPEESLEGEWAVMRDFGLSETAIPQKYKELIGLAVAAQIKCRYCIYFHTEAARAHGATDEELREANFMGGYTVQWSNALTGGQVDYEQFKREVDRAVKFMAGRTAGTRPEAAPPH